MRNRIRLDFDTSYGETLVAFYDIDRRQPRESSFHPAQSPISQPYRGPKFTRKSLNSSYMIIMFMGNHEPVDHLGVQAEPGKTKQGFLQGKTAIKQQPCICYLDYKAVSL